MPFLINRECVADSAALPSAQSIFPLIVSTGTGTVTTSPTILTLTTSSFNTSTGIFTFSTKNQAGAAVNTNSTMTFPVCRSPNISDYSAEIVLFYIALFVAFCFGFSSSYRP